MNELFKVIIFYEIDNSYVLNKCLIPMNKYSIKNRVLCIFVLVRVNISHHKNVQNRAEVITRMFLKGSYFTEVNTTSRNIKTHSLETTEVGASGLIMMRP